MIELKTNPNAEVTMIKEVGGCSVILQFKNYKDFLDYQRLEGGIDSEDNAKPKMAE